MKANELRIGNWIFDNGEEQKNYQVEEIRKDSEGFKGYYIVYRNGSFKAVLDDEDSFIEPIPLTEDWLLKFGFRPLDNKNWHLGKIKVWSGATGIYFQFNTPDDIDDVEIKYVHQIQNLYFALTGEELTVKQ